MPVRLRFRVAFLALALAGAFAVGCSKSAPRERVWLAPRVDLARWGTLGMIEFSASGGRRLGPLASREFLAALQSAQPGTPVLELGDERSVLAENGVDAFGPDAVRAIGERHRVDALIFGRLEAQTSAPGFAFDSGVPWASASAEFEGSLEVRILDTRTGATVWSAAAHASEPLARVGISSSGVSALAPSAGQDTELRLVRRLVGRATADFWEAWE